MFFTNTPAETDHHQCDNSATSYLDIVNEGGLVKPSVELVGKIDLLENIFRQCNITCNRTKAVRESDEQTKGIQISDNMKVKYFKT